MRCQVVSVSSDADKSEYIVSGRQLRFFCDWK